MVTTTLTLDLPSSRFSNSAFIDFAAPPAHAFPSKHSYPDYSKPALDQPPYAKPTYSYSPHPLDTPKPHHPPTSLRYPIRYPSTPSVPHTALPSPILAATPDPFHLDNPFDLAEDEDDEPEPFPEYVETMADFRPVNTPPPVGERVARAALERLRAAEGKGKALGLGGDIGAGTAYTGESEEEGTTVWERLFAPLLFVGFILGLYVVDGKNRGRFDSARSSTSSVGSVGSRSRSSTGGDASGSDWEVGKWTVLRRKGEKRLSNGSDNSGTTAVSLGTEEKRIGEKQSREGEAWFWTGKKRQLARREIADALEMRGRVAMGLVLVVMLGIAGVMFGGRWAVGMLRGGEWRKMLGLGGEWT